MALATQHQLQSGLPSTPSLKMEATESEPFHCHEESPASRSNDSCLSLGGNAHYSDLELSPVLAKRPCLEHNALDFDQAGSTAAPSGIPTALPSSEDSQSKSVAGWPSAPPSSNYDPEETTALENGSGKVTLWQFLLELLLSSKHSHLIRWTNNEGEFVLLQAEEVAKLWGLRKDKNHRMNYDKLSRALRYYYQKNIIRKVHGHKFVYQFTGFKHLLYLNKEADANRQVPTPHSASEHETNLTHRRTPAIDTKPEKTCESPITDSPFKLMSPMEKSSDFLNGCTTALMNTIAMQQQQQQQQQQQHQHQPPQQHQPKIVHHFDKRDAQAAASPIGFAGNDEVNMRTQLPNFLSNWFPLAHEKAQPVVPFPPNFLNMRGGPAEQQPWTNVLQNMLQLAQLANKQSSRVSTPVPAEQVSPTGRGKQDSCRPRSPNCACSCHGCDVTVSDQSSPSPKAPVPAMNFAFPKLLASSPSASTAEADAMGRPESMDRGVELHHQRHAINMKRLSEQLMLHAKGVAPTVPPPMAKATAHNEKMTPTCDEAAMTKANSQTATSSPACATESEVDGPRPDQLSNNNNNSSSSESSNTSNNNNNSNNNCVWMPVPMGMLNQWLNMLSSPKILGQEPQHLTEKEVL